MKRNFYFVIFSSLVCIVVNCGDWVSLFHIFISMVKHADQTMTANQNAVCVVEENRMES